MKALIPFAACAVLTLSACGESVQPEAALDGAWVLDADASRVNFVTVKAGQVAESHRFPGLSGNVTAAGGAELVIDLASVDTAVDIRNERMQEFLFEVAQFPAATISASVDPAAFSALASGDSVTQTVDLSVDLHGMQSTMPADLVITRTGADTVLVETAKPLIVSAATFGLDGGVEQLRELATLDSITGQVPVDVSLTFAREAVEE